MKLARHDQEATEAAVAHLLTESLLMIRYLSADGDRTVPVNRRQEQVHALADLCHKGRPATTNSNRRNSRSATM